MVNATASYSSTHRLAMSANEASTNSNETTFSAASRAAANQAHLTTTTATE